MQDIEMVQHCSCPSAMPACMQKCQVLPGFDQFYQILHNLQNSYQKLSQITHSFTQLHLGQKWSHTGVADGREQCCTLLAVTHKCWHILAKSIRNKMGAL